MQVLHSCFHKAAVLTLILSCLTICTCEHGASKRSPSGGERESQDSVRKIFDIAKNKARSGRLLMALDGKQK